MFLQKKRINFGKRKCNMQKSSLFEKLGNWLEYLFSLVNTATFHQALILDKLFLWCKQFNGKSRKKLIDKSLVMGSQFLAKGVTSHEIFQRIPINWSFFNLYVIIFCQNWKCLATVPHLSIFKKQKIIHFCPEN